MNIEKVDELTNRIMDILRKEFSINEDSDKDDKLYGVIHNEIKNWTKGD